MKPKAIRKAIGKDIAAWSRTLGIGDWYFYVAFERHDDGEVASCRAHAQYHEARLSFDPKQMSRRGLDRSEVRRTVVHELMHCVCNGYEQTGSDFALEEMVSRITNIVVDLSE